MQPNHDKPQTESQLQNTQITTYYPWLQETSTIQMFRDLETNLLDERKTKQLKSN